MHTQPNILVLHADQFRGDCLNSRRVGLYTPNLDSLANQGADFTSCYSACPICIPQRITLLTGQTPAHHGAFSHVTTPNIPFETTLPTEMGRGGYQTALVGRTMHTYPFTNSQGFEYYLPGDPSSNLKDTTDAFFKYIRENAPAEEGGYYGCGAAGNSRVGAPFHLDDRFHQTKWVTNRALDFLSNRDESRPFMLFVGFYAPHSPLNPPAEYFNRYLNRDDLDTPYLGNWEIPPACNGATTSHYVDLKGEELRHARAGYYGNITFMDNQIGRILALADQIPNTYVIFTADHGEMLGDHYCFHKNRPYQGSVHTPFVIKGPGIHPARQIDQPIGWQDIMPTLLDIAGLPIPDSVDGQSFLPLLNNEKTASPWREYMHGEAVHDGVRYYNCLEEQIKENNVMFEKGSHYLTDGKIKYIWFCTTGREQLFDIEHDYGELHDLINDPTWQNVLNKMRHALAKLLADREEGFSDGTNLIAGREPLPMSSKLRKLDEQRRLEHVSM